jgi:hypothetical protein
MNRFEPPESCGIRDSNRFKGPNGLVFRLAPKIGKAIKIIEIQQLEKLMKLLFWAPKNPI